MNVNQFEHEPVRRLTLNKERVMRRGCWTVFICVVILVLSACLSDDHSSESASTTQATITIGVNLNDPRLAGTNRALNPSPPAAVTKIMIRVLSPSQELAAADILASGGVLTLTVPPGIALTVQGTAFANEELRYKGETRVEPLLPGLGASVKLNLESTTGPDFSLPVQIDVTATGISANAPGSAPVFSQNNRKVLFRSLADNLIIGDSKDTPDLFVKDLFSGALSPVHTATDGTAANGPAGAADISADGEQIVFASAATNLDDTADTNASRDVFLKNLTDRTVTRLSGASNVPGDSGSPTISDNGGVVIFESAADLLGIGQMGIFRVDLANVDLAGNRTLQSIQFVAPGREPKISGDGQSVLWYDPAAQALRLHNLQTETTSTVVAPLSIGDPAGAPAYNLSKDGRFVVFATPPAPLSRALTFSPGIYLFDRDAAAAAPRLVSTNAEAQVLTHETAAPREPSLSDDGRFVAFALDTTLYVKNTQTQALATLSTPGTGPTLSSDGSLIAFTAGANQNLFVLHNPLFDSSTPGPAAVTFTLNVAREGEGGGRVSSDTGLDCGDLCTQSLTAGTLVRLTATPNEFSEFTGWSGDCSGVSPDPSVTLTANSRGYPLRIICGIITDPIEAVSATDEPEMQPNMVEATMLTSARPPRMKPTKTLARSIIRPAMPPSPMMAPARMKKGIASSGKSSMPSDVFSAIASSGIPIQSAAKMAARPSA